MSVPSNNVVLIAVDDLRPEINCFGKTKLHTPHLDRLAQNGMLFTRAYCQAPQCMPSRASLMSGIRPDAHVYSHIADICTHGELTLPGLFKQSNYTSVSVGKTYHWNDEDEESWTRKYRDTFYEEDYTCDGYCTGYQFGSNKERVKNFHKQFEPHTPDTFDRNVELPDICEAADAPDSAYPDSLISDIAVNELEQLSSQENPFFLSLGYYRPHLPWAVPKRYWDLYKREDIDLADNPFLPKDGVGCSDMVDLLHYGDKTINDTYSDVGQYKEQDFPLLAPEKQRECIHGYWASVSFVDAQIGRVLEKMSDLGLLENTTIVLFGDNGWHLGEHKLWTKCTSFEESTRVPLIVSDARFTTAGNTTESLVELLDIYPMLAYLCGIDLPKHLDGRSLRPILEDPKNTVKQVAYSRLRNFQSVRTDDFRFTWFEKEHDRGDRYHLPNPGNVELFDLKKDPGENVNVAKEAEYAQILQELVQYVDRA